MDHALTTAARALAVGDALGALALVALRDDPPALALRGVAMAQLGELERARVLLQRARQAFPVRERLARARCTLAEAEVALATRDFRRARTALTSAFHAFTSIGDRTNAVHARLLEARLLVWLGHMDAAAHTLDTTDLRGAPAMLVTRAELVRYELSLRHGRSDSARTALRRAWASAQRSRIPALVAEVDHAARALELPIASLMAAGEERMLRLHEVEALLRSSTLVVDACRRVVRRRARVVTLQRRPVLFALARTLAQAFPGEVTRQALVHAAFAARRVDASHRARLRVEMGRLRRALSGLASVSASPQGYVLVPRATHEVAVLLPPVHGEGAALRALLSDGESWSTSALALTLGASQRSVQRLLKMLLEQGQVRSSGRGRAQRWLAPPVSGFATALLLPGAGWSS